MTDTNTLEKELSQYEMKQQEYDNLIDTATTPDELHDKNYEFNKANKRAYK